MFFYIIVIEKKLFFGYNCIFIITFLVFFKLKTYFQGNSRMFFFFEGWWHRYPGPINYYYSYFMNNKKIKKEPTNSTSYLHAIDYETFSEISDSEVPFHVKRLVDN